MEENQSPAPINQSQEVLNQAQQKINQAEKALGQAQQKVNQAEEILAQAQQPITPTDQQKLQNPTGGHKIVFPDSVKDTIHTRQDDINIDSKSQGHRPIYQQPDITNPPGGGTGVPPKEESTS